MLKKIEALRLSKTMRKACLTRLAHKLKIAVAARHGVKPIDRPLQTRRKRIRYSDFGSPVKVNRGDNFFKFLNLTAC